MFEHSTNGSRIFEQFQQGGARLKLRAIGRHWFLQLSLVFSRAQEHMKGIAMFLGWLPGLAAAGLSGKRRVGPFVAQKSWLPYVESRCDVPFFLINLDARVDRLEESLQEFAKIGLRPPARVAATAHPNGALGCAASHISVLERLARQDFEMAVVCEDDIAFVARRQELEALLEDFFHHPSIGVLCISNRVRGPRLPISRHMAISNNVQTTACYAIKPWAVEAVLSSFRESARELASGAPLHTASIDQTWKKIQGTEIFFGVPRISTARQRESFSDIAKKRKLYK